MESRKLLSIAIPTYNRSKFLDQNLTQLKKELTTELSESVEILVSDNCSTDDTSEVINRFQQEGMIIQYYKNNENLGWGRNFIQCFENSKGKYVLLLGDDDLIYDGVLKYIISILKSSDLGVLYLRPYGFTLDYKSEYPGSFGEVKKFNNSSDFILALGSNSTLISCCIINRDYIKESDYKNKPLGNFAHMLLNIPASIRANENLFINKYMVACKRNNSSNYEFSSVFVTELWKLFESFEEYGFSNKSCKKLMRNMLLTYYPYYFLLLRLDKSDSFKKSLVNCDNTFKKEFLYSYWNKPILTLPKPLALIWGFFATLIGRALNGELFLGFIYIRNIVFTKIKKIN